MYRCMYVCTYVRMCVCVYIYVCVCMYVCTHEYTYANYISDRHIFQKSKSRIKILGPRKVTSHKFHTETCQNSAPA
jgi:ABC-type polar amino acid transport system ATPase subunit